jgi:ribonuclease HIII
MNNMNKNVSFIVDITLEPIIKKELEGRGFEFSPINFAFWRAKNRDGSTITFYKTGKVLFQGKDTEKIVDFFIQNRFIKNNTTTDISKWIGVDESGKGDFFGPLVIAGVLMTRELQDFFLNIGVTDSKTLSDSVVTELSQEIKNRVVYFIVVISPLKYNHLYDKIKNLNKLLAWGHSRVIENILQQQEVKYAIIDKFSKKESRLLQVLMARGKKIEIKQQHHAEQDIAVAAASILARAKFNEQIEIMSQKYKIKFPKGASQKVIQAGIDFNKKYGKDQLKQVAKIHFKTYQKILFATSQKALWKKH